MPGFSGAAGHLAPVIAPGDSFEVRFTPPRAGTFIYHTHVDEERQEPAGRRPEQRRRESRPALGHAGQAKVTDPVTQALVNNTLYDPNYRKFDVEGYRIYRGRVDALRSEIAAWQAEPVKR